jgi:DNA cross-link repair 1C protein
MLLAGLRSKGRAISLDHMGFNREEDELSIDSLTKVLTKSVVDKRRLGVNESVEDQILPRVITFPYSRHSSYAELCHLVRIFQPKDVFPCTVDEDNWHEGMSFHLLPRPTLHRWS